MDKILSKKYKLEEYYKLLNKWLSIKINCKEISEYFKIRKMYKTAIYGLGELGKRLYDDLINNKSIDIKYFIDNTKTMEYRGVDVFNPDGGGKNA